MNGRTRRTVMSVAVLTCMAVVGPRAVAQGPRFAFVHQMLPADADLTTALAVGDVDADGDPDLLVANGSPHPNRLYRNDGLGGYSDVTVTTLPPDTDGTRDLALGDVDGDGDLDAFIGNVVGQNRLYLNDGTGIFADVTATHVPAVSGWTQALALGDVDGDGDLDALIGNGDYSGTNQQNRLYLNGGNGIFGDVTSTQLPVDLNHTRAVALGDVDGDGDLDAVIGNDGEPNCLYRNDGSGVFSDVTPGSMPTDADASYALALGDVDGDGDLDLLIGNWLQQNRLYLNDGTGTFSDATAALLPVAMDGTWDLVLGDVDGDGDLDAFIGNSDGYNLNRLLLNDGSGHLLHAPEGHLRGSPWDYVRAVRLADLDADGDLDAVTGNADQQNRLYLNDGSGIFADVTGAGLPVDYDETQDVALGDLDGDGDLDAFVGNRIEPSRLYLNEGTGIFLDATDSHLTVDYLGIQSMALGDLDGDGDLDALLGHGFPGYQNRLGINDGTGRLLDFATPTLPPDSGSTLDVALGDLDGDGDLDALIGNGGAPSRLLINNGAGIFFDLTAFLLPPIPGPVSSIALGDVDGDGDLDAVFAHAFTQKSLYLNNGLAPFSDVTASNLPVDSTTTHALALGDVDGDGDLDLLIATTGQDRLYVNDGLGVFADATATRLLVGISISDTCAFGDLDADGDLDALIGSRSHENRLYVNDGLGTFTDGTAGALPRDLDKTTSLAIGDVDGDGDLDFLAGTTWTGRHNRLYTNLLGQLAWRDRPRFAKPLPIDIFGPPGQPWVLLASAGTANIFIPSWGTFRLDLASLVVAGSGIIGPGGRSSASYPMPPNPGGFAGWTVWGQAVVGSPPRLTNLERITFTDL